MEVQIRAVEDMWAYVVGSNRALAHNEDLHDLRSSSWHAWERREMHTGL
jgi:hypothetical protein